MKKKAWFCVLAFFFFQTDLDLGQATKVILEREDLKNFQKTSPVA